MTAYNTVRFKVKAGKEKAFEDTFREAPDFKGFIEGALIKTGERTYCMIGKWTDFESIAAARPLMVARLDKSRDMLEDLGGGLGPTDPVSGKAVVELNGGKR